MVGVNLQLHCYFLKELEEVIENLEMLMDRNDASKQKQKAKI